MRKIPGYENLYSITECGSIWSHPKTGSGGHCGKWLKTSVGTDGYRHIILSKEKNHYNCLVHRLMGYAYLQKPINATEINHIDGNKLNNHVSNLEWVTRSQNLKHAFLSGLSKPCKHSVETKAKLSAINKNKILTIEHKTKIKNNNAKAKKVTNGIKIYNCAIDASREMGFNSSAVAHSIARKNKCGGYVWTYLK